MGHGIVADLWTTRYDEMKSIMVGIPSFEEQTVIAAFLDRKTVLIDQAIGIKQKQIELLKERRQILIHKAVTRGLDPNVKMKDSGVEWIGEIPEGWEVKRLKDVCNINLNSLPENTNKNFEFKYVDIGSVTLETGINNTEVYTFKNAPSRARRIAKVGDTVISTVRTYLKAIDFIDQIKSSYIYSTGFAILQPKEFIYPEFLGYFVRSNAFTEQVTVNSKGMSYPAINSTDIGRLTVVHCKTIEQKQIVDYIESNNAKIATTISLKEQEIEKLKEYKSTLINYAVTGKIKVFDNGK
jgi:type I restriction enzyme S subunit